MVNPETTRTAIDSLTWLLQHLHLASGELEDRGTVRRAIEATAEAWPGTPAENWWKWTVESCKSLGLRASVIDCRFNELLEAIRNGAHVLIWTRLRGGIVITQCSRNKFLVGETLPVSKERWVTETELLATLGDPALETTIRAVFTQAETVVRTDRDSADRSVTPLSRFLGLLRTERSDIAAILVFSVFSGLLAMATPLAIESLVNTVAFGRFLQPIVILAIILFAFLAFSAALQALSTYVAEIIQWRMFVRIGTDLAYRIPRLQWQQMDNRNTPEMVNRFFEVVTVQKVASNMLLDGISVILNVLVGMAVLAFYNPWLLGFDIILLALIFVAILIVGRGGIDTSIRESKSKYAMAEWLEALAHCPLAFRLAGGGEFALERADRLTFDYLTRRRRHFRVLMRQIVFFLSLQALASTALLALGGWLVITGQLTVGQLVAAELIVTIIVGSLAKLGKHIEGFYDVMASADKLGDLFDMQIEKQVGIQRPEADEAAHVELCSVSYRHSDSSVVFNDVIAEITSGSRWALTGPAGSGKSVLLDILFGLRIPSHGHVLLDGVDPEDMRNDTLRDEVALVRDVEVFPGTISENVSVMRTNISPVVIRESLDSVGLLDTVLGLPDGINTKLHGTNGPLTGSQQRRLMIARAIVGNPRLLLIDGLLDQLADSEAEQIMAILAQAKTPWTLVLVTGRDSIRRFCDQELDLENGQVRVLPA